MMKILYKSIMVGLGVLLLTSPTCAEDNPKLKARRDCQSYALGVEVMRNFKQQGFEFDLDLLMRGMKDVAAGNKLLMDEYDLKTSLSMASSEIRVKKAMGRLNAQQDNKKKGEEFLAANKSKEGVVTLPSGLQYKVLKASKGKMPIDEDYVEFRYRGTRIDGTEFDNSGAPKIMNIADLIPGWREALQLMNVGSKWQFFIPSQLAYGQRGSGAIGPYETTIYEFELIDIKGNID